MLFGVLWALWHLPSSLSFDHDSLTQIGPSFLLSCLNCIAFGTFLAFIYLKTHNIWLAILIHFCNNNLPLMLPQADTWIQATASTLIQLAIFLPFLFSNVFRRAPSP
ncbi:type II CAAX prenyl endopeptidase Rce1 family protein [Evtepia gabavorous]|uniref:CPBP family glutamic-type intramembrane protease n=1 Tax=Evtepia gabavorous TaxID=2211183 RepID=UPI003A93427F